MLEAARLWVREKLLRCGLSDYFARCLGNKLRLDGVGRDRDGLDLLLNSSAGFSLSQMLVRVENLQSAGSCLGNFSGCRNGLLIYVCVGEGLQISCRFGLVFGRRPRLGVAAYFGLRLVDGGAGRLVTGVLAREGKGEGCRSKEHNGVCEKHLV